jgi:hypothetical protein
MESAYNDAARDFDLVPQYLKELSKTEQDP